MAAFADLFQYRVSIVLDVDPVDIDARRHDVADGPVADAEHAGDHLLLLLVQQSGLLTCGDQELQLFRRVQRLFRSPGTQPARP